MSKRLGIHDPWITELETTRVQDALASGWISGMGPYVKSFETKLEQHFMGAFPLAVNSGSSALHLAMQLANVQPGDHILLCLNGFIAAANAIRQLGAEPIFLGPENPAVPVISKAQIERFFAEEIREGKFRKTLRPIRGMIYHQPYGLVDESLTSLVDFLHSQKMFLVEDASHSWGLNHQGRPLGCHGDFGVLSMNGNKTISSGTGGVLICRTETERAKAKRLSHHAREDAFDFFYGEKGNNFLLSNSAAAIGSAQLERLPKILQNKILIRNWYRDSLSLPLLAAEMTYPAWLNVALLPRKLERTEFACLAKKLIALGIEVRPTMPPLSRNAGFEESPRFWDSNCDFLFDRGLCLPSGAMLEKKDVELVAQNLERLFREL